MSELKLGYLRPKTLKPLRAYRLRYLKSPHAPETLWEYEEPWIHQLLVNARRFGTAELVQRYFRSWGASARENERIWEKWYRQRALYDDVAGWWEWLVRYREVMCEVWEIGEKQGYL